MSRKNSSSEIPQFTFDEHHHGPRIDSTRTHQAAFAAQHAFVHLFIDALIFAPAHERMEFAEIEIRKVAGRTGRRTAAAADAAAHGLGADIQNLGIDAGGVQFPGDEGQGGVGAALLVGAAVDEQNFHAVYSPLLKCAVKCAILLL